MVAAGWDALCESNLTRAGEVVLTVLSASAGPIPPERGSGAELFKQTSTTLPLPPKLRLWTQAQVQHSQLCVKSGPYLQASFTNRSPRHLSSDSPVFTLPLVLTAARLQLIVECTQVTGRSSTSPRLG